MTLQPIVLIVDDEKHTRDGLRGLLENDYDVYVTADIAGAMDMLEREQVDVLLTDLRLGSEDGMVLIDGALKIPRPPICIMMTAYGSVELAVEAMKRGAYDFVTKPLNLDKVELLIARAVQGRKLEQENRALREQVDERYGLENIWGDSAALHEVLETIKQVAPSSANVLIEGESGTGKELAAHAIHNLSRRNKAKFVVVHCAALSPQLLESELFGHEKGAFTGAHERRIGRFEQANSGTLFLDEIAEIDPSTQVKLLRVISEERTFERVGGNQTLRADVRLIAATNKNLGQLVREGKFRDDLYFRLNVVRIVMPPLRERKEDIPLFTRHFLKELAATYGRRPREITDDAIEALMRYTWPGNVRELRNVIERIVIMNPTTTRFDAKHLPPLVYREGSRRAPKSEFSTLHQARDAYERDYILKTLDQNHGNVSRTAEILGLERSHLYRKMKALGLAAKE